MNISGIETILNGLLSGHGSTTSRIAAIAEFYQQSAPEARQAIAMQLARVAITNGEIVHSLVGKHPDLSAVGS